MKFSIVLLQLPFPAITFCPITVFSANEVNLTEIERRRLNSEPMINATKYDFDQVKTALEVVCYMNAFYNRNPPSAMDMDADFDLLFEKLSPKNFIGSCVINDIEYDNCTNFFNKFMTDTGICYTFNQLKMVDLFYDNVLVIIELFL